MDGAPPLLFDDADETAVAPPAQPIARLDRLPTPDAWEELARGAAEPNPFFERAFLRPSLRHLGEDGTRLLTVWQGARLVGLLPVGRRRGYARMPLRLLVNWAHPNMFLGTPLVLAGREEAFWRAALACLDEVGDSDLIHLSALPAKGPVLAALLRVASADERPADVVHREERALFAPTVPGHAYYQAAVRKKKRKEIGRLGNRLADLGPVARRVLGADEDVAPWAERFLALEAAGWKGEAGSALASAPDTRAFFLDMIAAAHARGRLDFVSLDVGGRAVAMLCTILDASGREGFSFKIAYDEALARLSPGVLLQVANMDLAERRGLAAVDSCAAPDHPMIDSLWAERRSLVRVTLALGSRRSRLLFRLARAAERAAAARRARPTEEPAQ